MLYIKGLLSSQLPTLTSPCVWQQHFSRTENMGGSLPGSEFVFQLRSAPAAQTGAEWCSVTSALWKGSWFTSGKQHLSLSFPQTSNLCFREFKDHTASQLSCVTCTEMHTGNTPGPSFLFSLCSLNNPTTIPQFTQWSQENNGEALLS